MKTFDQLTDSEKTEAVSQARITLCEMIEEGIVNFGAGDALTDKTIDYYALAAAEGSFYSEAGDRIIEGIAG